MRVASSSMISARAAGWGLACCGWVLVGCKSTKADGAVVATDSAAVTIASSANTVGTDGCQKLKKAVVDEAAKLATCETAADCKVHGIQLCGWDELDCYAAHVNATRSAASLDEAVSAYAKSCPVNKCKCEMPQKSTCRSGKCVAE